jgi:hypothetical protein
VTHRGCAQQNEPQRSASCHAPLTSHAQCRQTQPEFITRPALGTCQRDTVLDSGGTSDAWKSGEPATEAHTFYDDLVIWRLLRLSNWSRREMLARTARRPARP